MVRNSQTQEEREVSTFKEEKLYLSSPKSENNSQDQWQVTWAPPDSTSSKKSSSCNSKCFPGVKERHDKESQSTSSKHKDKSCGDKSSKHSSDKEANKSLHKHCMSPTSQPSSTERAGKECCLEDTTHTSSADTRRCPQSPSRCMSETKHQSSFAAPLARPLPTRLGVCHASIPVPLTAGAQ